MHRADVRRDRHLVVIQYDDDVAVRTTGVIQALVREAGRQGAIADDGRDLELLPGEIPPRGDAERGGNRRGGVPRAERVVLALAALEEARYAVLLAQRLHSRVAPGEQLVRVALVPDVPDELVTRRVEHRVERDRQFDDPEPSADMPARRRAHRDQALAHLGCERAQLVA